MFGRLVVLVGLAAVAVAFSARPSDGASAGDTYVVRAGDTLWSIAAARYPGDVREGVWELQQRNRLHGAVIRPGQRLSLP